MIKEIGWAEANENPTDVYKRQSYYQLHVPFLIWLSKAYREENVEVNEDILQNREKPVAGNASVFHTMRNLAGIQTPYRADSLSVANRQYLIRPRYYLNDHNLPTSVNSLPT